MLILAFDTTAAACSVAIWRDDKVLGFEQAEMKQGQAEALVPMIERALVDCGIDYAALDLLAVTVGPGSFTGVRVGIATARAMGLAANKPVVGVRTTEVLAAAAPEKSARILAAVDTKRGDLYAQLFDQNRMPHGGIRVVALSDLAQWVGPEPMIVVGDAAAAVVDALGYYASLSAASPLPDPATLARLASTRESSNQNLVPVYARAPDAAIPIEGGRLRP
jgi:tRNA threonylcarbamoyladenosine biosynthesis protein TsaB